MVSDYNLAQPTVNFQTRATFTHHVIRNKTHNQLAYSFYFSRTATRYINEWARRLQGRRDKRALVQACETLSGRRIVHRAFGTWASAFFIRRAKRELLGRAALFRAQKVHALLLVRFSQCSL